MCPQFTRSLSVYAVTIGDTGPLPSVAVFQPDPFPQSDRLIIHLPAGSTGVGTSTLKVNLYYTGSLASSVGLYASNYTNGTATVPLAVTMFEPSFARIAFPCLDEPALKASFNLSLTGRAAGYTALSNMPATGRSFRGHGVIRALARHVYL